MFLAAILLFLGGLLASSRWIISQKAEAKDFILKLKPYEGGIGVALLITGVLSLLFRLDDLGYMLRYTWGLVALAAIIVEILLGFVLGYALIDDYLLNKNPEVHQKGKSFYRSLTRYQTPLGLTALVLSVLWLLIQLKILF